MSSQSREKIALLVFTALILLSLLGLIWYIFAGHSWNVAASNIDDTVGDMSGYTAIVYAGTQEPEDDTSAGSTGEVGSGKVESTGASTTADEVDAKRALSAFSSDSTEKETSSAVDASRASADQAAEEKSIETAEPGEDSASSSQLNLFGSFPFSSQKRTLTVEQAKASYEEKQATVFALDTADLGQYVEGTILKKGPHRFGVFSVVKPLSNIEIEKKIAYYKRLNVDFIVALVPDATYLERVSGIDIVISTQDEDLFVMGETKNGTFYVDAPEVGKVGAILISPSNVVSAKVLEAS